jgi:hypothetical protein
VRETNQHAVSNFLGAPRWAIRKYIGLLARYWILAPTRTGRWLSALREAALMKGYIEECRRLTRAKSASTNP